MMMRHFWRYFRTPLTQVLQRTPKKRGKKSRSRRGLHLQAERLESREMLAVTPISFDAALSQIVIRGTAVDESSVVSYGPNDTVNVRFKAGGEITEATFQRSIVLSIDFKGGAGNDRFENATDLPSRALGEAGDDVLLGGSAIDYFLGGDGNDRLQGNQGNDELHGQAGNDQLYGQDGDDQLTGGLDVDLLVGGTGHDQLTGNEGNDDLYGDQGNDRLLGLDGNDKLLGGDGDDELLGGLGDDRLYGNSGNDKLFGEAGNDELYGQDDQDVMTGGAGNDVMGGGAGNDELTGNEGNDQLYGQDGDDRLLGLDGDDYISAGAGNDYVLGGTGNDQIFGDAGDDELYGQEGHDQIFGGDGNDKITGWMGNDLLYGDGGNDDIDGEEGDDVLRGGAGVDDINGGDGNDELYGNEGDDLLYGSTGNDYISGDEDNDQLYGQDGDDTLFGQLGNDQLFGSYGNDTLVGHDGNDVLKGDNGNDVLIGGDGSDEVQGQSGDDIVIGGGTSHDSDRSMLSALSQAWSSAEPYATRIANIENEEFAAPLIANETIIDDKAADSVFGGDDQDWFFQTGYMSVYVPEDVHHEEDVYTEWRQAFGSNSPTSDANGNGVVDAADYAWLKKLGATSPASGSGGHEGGHHHDESVINYLPELEGFDLISATDMFSDRESTEAIRSTMPHPDAPVLQREHLSLFETVRYDQLTHYAIHDGAWSNPGTWHDGQVPADGAHVLIPLNVEVQVDTVVAARLSTIRIDGTLSFDTTADTELRVDTVVVSGSGTFEMGSELTPIQADATARLLFTDDGPIDRSVDPFGISRGLVSHGNVSIHGAEVTSYVALTSSALAGSTALTLRQIPVGWKVGDTIVVASTTEGPQENEVRQIAAISGSLVILDQPLTYNHIPARADFEIHVANVTRNAVIESESSDVERRGHVMFMHNRNVHIAYGGFYQLGRTNKLTPIVDAVVGSDWSLQAGTGTNTRGRYAVHFHRNGLRNDGNPSTISGSAVVDSAGWGFVNHSSYVDMTDNVAFDVHGAAFSTEVGDEIGSFDGNMAIGSTGSGETVNSRIDIQDFGHQGDGFWFHGGGISVTNNIAAGNEGNGFAFYSRGLIENGETKTFLAANLDDPSIANGAATIDVRHVPMKQFENNVGYSSLIGLMLRYHMQEATHGQQSIFESSTFWNNARGVDVFYTWNTVLRDLTVVASSEMTPDLGIGLNSETRSILYDNLTVSGYWRGIEVAKRGQSEIRGGTFNNFEDIYISSGISADRTVLLTGFSVLPRIVLANNFSTVNGSLGHLFTPDIVTLNFGSFVNKRVYYTSQAANAVPFPAPISGLPAQYVGLTNQQLWNQYKVALGGAVAPLGSITIPQIVGLIAP